MAVSKTYVSEASVQELLFSFGLAIC
jgi:hypothetical protein